MKRAVSAVDESAPAAAAAAHSEPRSVGSGRASSSAAAGPAGGVGGGGGGGRGVGVGVTGEKASEIKRVYAAYLSEERCGVSKEMMRQQRAHFFQDELYRLLTDNGTTAREHDECLQALNRHVRLARGGLQLDGVLQYPAERSGIARIVERYMGEVLGSRDPLAKRAFLLVALRLSPSYVAVFCPRDGASKFLCNPEKMARFVQGADTEFSTAFAEYIVSTTSKDMFVARATNEWASMEPWAGMQQWKAVSPVASSLEIKMLTGQPVDAAERRIASQYLLPASGTEAIRAAAASAALTPAATAKGLGAGPGAGALMVCSSGAEGVAGLMGSGDGAALAAAAADEHSAAWQFAEGAYDDDAAGVGGEQE